MRGPTGKRRRRRLRWLAPPCALLLLALLVGIQGRSILRPPRGPRVDPCTVYFLHTPIHVEIALPDESGRYASYAYGDRTFMSTYDWKQYPWGTWLFFAGIPGCFTSGVVGRVEYRGATRDDIAREWGWELDSFEVERPRALALRRALDAKCGAPLRDVPTLHETSDRYSLWWNNCHTVMAGWLRELGCDVSRAWLAPRWLPWRIEREP